MPVKKWKLAYFYSIWYQIHVNDMIDITTGNTCVGHKNDPVYTNTEDANKQNMVHNSDGQIIFVKFWYG